MTSSMTGSEIITALIAKGYGVFIDSGDDGEDEHGKPFTYHVAATAGEWDDLVIEMGRYGHDWEEALERVWEEVQARMRKDNVQV